jgi:hypothetical protein
VAGGGGGGGGGEFLQLYDAEKPPLVTEPSVWKRTRMLDPVEWTSPGTELPL